MDTDELWAAHAHAVRVVGDFKSSMPIGARRSNEQRYAAVCRQLRKAGLIPTIKAKYRRTQ